MNIKLSRMRENPMIAAMVWMIWMAKTCKVESREQKMNTTTEKSVLSQLSAAGTAPVTSASGLATGMLAAGVAALVVMADHLIDDWAETHVVAAWLALWVVAVMAIAALRGVSRMLAQGLMAGLDAWSADLARRRADERLWAMAQQDGRLMQDLQAAMDRAETHGTPAADLATYKARRVARMVNSRMYYI